MNWFVFAAVLLAPIIASCVAGTLDSSNGDLAPGIAFFGGALGGIVGGAMLGWRFGKTTGVKTMLGIVFAGVLAVACIGASCFGCLASGYQFNIR
jgi:hypothetical protein